MAPHTWIYPSSRALGRGLSVHVPLAVGLLALMCGGCGNRDAPQANTSLGEAFPYVRFIGQEGQIVDLAAAEEGRKSLLVFMRGFSGFVCPYCTAQTAELSGRRDEIEAANTDLHIVYPGAAETIPKFLEAVQAYLKEEVVPDPPLSVLMDVDLKAVDALGIREDLAKPCTFVLDSRGKLLYEYVGANPMDRPALDAVLEALEGVGE